jgi:hypothetical protein
MTKCAWHLCQNEAKVKYCSVKCKNKGTVNTFRREQKRKSVEYKGGKCLICGYSKCQEALHFHHLNPNEKDFGIGENGRTKVWEEVKKELDKCVCLCSNCHAEVHAGVTNIG